MHNDVIHARRQMPEAVDRFSITGICHQPKVHRLDGTLRSVGSNRDTIINAKIRIRSLANIIFAKPKYEAAQRYYGQSRAHRADPEHQP